MVEQQRHDQGPGASARTVNRKDDPTGDEHLTAAAAVLNPSIHDRLVGDGTTPLGELLAADATDPLEGL